MAFITCFKHSVNTAPIKIFDFYWRPPASTVPKKIPVLTTGDPAFTLRIAAPTVPTIPVYATIAALVFSLIERFESFRSSSS